MILNPLLLLIVLYTVFSMVMKLDLAHYQIFLLLGIIVWNFFQETTKRSIDVIESSMDTIKKVKIKIHTLILGSIISSSISFLINICILICMMMFFRINVFTPIRALSIFYFILLFLYTISMSFIFSTLYILFKDIKHIWEFLILIGFWLSPIVYPETLIPIKYLKYYMLNPIARIISHLRNSIIYNFVDSLHQIIITTIITLSLLFLSIWFYKKFSKKIYQEL